MKKMLMLLFGFFPLFSPAVAQDPEDPPATDNELMVQTMNAVGDTTQYELVPIGLLHCTSGSCVFQLYANPPTQLLSLIGNVICLDVGFKVRVCSRGDNLDTGGCSTPGNGIGALRYGFYRVNIYVNEELRRYFYYDTRDCGLVTLTCGTCSGNDITIRYDVANDIVWWSNAQNDDPEDPDPQFGWQTLSPGQILKYAEIKNCSPPCFQPFWDNGLVVIPQMGSEEYNVPHLVWGSYSAFTPTGYKVYWKSSTGQPADFTLLADLSAGTTEYSHEGIPVGGPYTAYYKVQAYNTSQQSGFTNTASIDFGNLSRPYHGGAGVEAGGTVEAAAYPNPFNPTTVINYVLRDELHVNLVVFDVLGRTVVTLVDGVMKPGKHEVLFDAGAHVSGTYFYQLTAGNTTTTGKLLLVR